MSFLDFLDPYKKIIWAVSILTAVALIGWAGHRFLEYERDIGRNEVQARWDKQKLKDQEAALKQQEAWAAQIDKANQERALYEQRLQALADALGTTSDRLRDTISTKRAGLATASADAARQAADSFGAVLSDCRKEYEQLAKAADGHVGDVREFEAKWPRAGVKESQVSTKLPATE